MPMYTHYATVLNVVQAKTKYGVKLALNTKLEDGSQATCWSSELDNPLFLSQKPGNRVRLIKGARGGYTLLVDTPSMSTISNGNGHNGSPSNTLSTQTYSQRNDNGHSTAVNHQEVVEDLDLPQPLTDAQKKAIHKLCIERARLLVHSIEVVRKELDNKGIEFHEGSIRSLGVSLFINISRHLP